MYSVPLLIENLHKKINKSIEKSGKAPIVNSMIHVTNALKTVGVLYYKEPQNLEKALKIMEARNI